MIRTFLLILLLAGPLTAHSFTTGKPSALEPKNDYYKAAMDDGKAGRHEKAAQKMRLAYYQNPDSYRLFWYLYWLDRAGFYNELLTEYTTAPLSNRTSTAYHTWAMRLAATAFLRTGNPQGAYDVLLDAYDQALPDRPEVFRMLSEINWKDYSTGHRFITGSRFHFILTDMMKELESAYYTNSGLALAVCRAGINGAAWLLSQGHAGIAAELSTNLAVIAQMAGLKDPIINPAHMAFYRDAVTFRAVNPPGTNTAYCDWLCLTITGIDTAVKIKGRVIPVKTVLSPAFIEEKTRDNLLEAGTAALIYYYLTGGALEMRFQVQVHQGTIRGLRSDNIYNQPDLRTVSPYPVKIFSENYNRFDGILYFTPLIEGSLYLGGAVTPDIIPHLLPFPGPRLQAWMLTGASFNVMVHEMFHNFESRYKLPATHFYIEENRKNWPAWYTALVKENGATAEWLYYARLMRDSVIPAGMVPMALKNMGGSYPAAVLDWSWKAYNRYGAAKWRESGLYTDKGRELAGQKQYGMADKEFAKALAVVPENPQALFSRAYYFQWGLKDIPAAQRLYDQYLLKYAGFPDTATAVNYTLVYNFNQGRHADNLKLVSNYIVYLKKPGDIYNARLFEAMAWRWLKEPEKARAVVTNALSAPDNPLKERFNEELKKLGS